MKIRLFAAGIAAVLITGGAATVFQRVITQKTRLVLPAKNDSAHADSRSLVIAAAAIPSQDVGTSPPVPAVPTNDSPSHPVDPPAMPTLPVAAEKPTPPPMILHGAETSPAPSAVEPTIAVVTEPDPGPKPANEPPVTDPAVNLAADHGVAGTSTAARGELAKGDPLELVESFVERNRKEAESAIQTLTTESENLKARLAKVEAALIRWQTFSRALNADQPTAQSAEPAPAKANWKRPEPEPPARPTELPAPENPPAPAPDSPPTAQSPEVQPAGNVPASTEPPAAEPGATKPPELPTTPAPENPPSPQS